jgi:3-phenylpropionate/trans-cinnamate dioxygenase ferredoxin reductase subunit
VFELRTIDDAGAIGRRLAAGSRLLVIGGGWIGLEVAATARQKGVAVTLVEAGERLCARSVPPVLGDFLLARHIGQGVLIRLKTTVQSIEPGDAGRVLVNIDGENGQFDAVVVGIGIVPNTRLASDCGLKVTDGIVVDASGRTSDPDVYAVGDVANQHCSSADGRVRFESWAHERPESSDLRRYGDCRHRNSVRRPSLVWSDQYDFSLQVLGVPAIEGRQIVRGSLDDYNFSVFQLVDRRLRAVMSVNSPRDIKMARRWMRDGVCPPVEALADTTQRFDRLDGGVILRS